MKKLAILLAFLMSFNGVYAASLTLQSAETAKITWTKKGTCKVYKSNKKSSGYKLYKKLNKNKLTVSRGKKTTYYKVFNGKTTSKPMKCKKIMKRSGNVYDYVIKKLKKYTLVNVDGYKLKEKDYDWLNYYVCNAYPVELKVSDLNFIHFDDENTEIEEIEVYKSKKEKERSKKAKEVLDKVRVNGSTYEKAKQLHDWVIEHAEYGNVDDITQHEAYGVAVKGKAICEGYALCYQYLCNINGVPCRTESDINGTHAWNTVRIGDTWYVVDCTWDEPGRYKYFLVSDQTHGIKSQFCTCNLDY